jgi:hypothetical protein
MSDTLRNFGHLKMGFFNGHESFESKVSCFRCVILRHLFGLKIRFLKFLKALTSRVRGYRWTHILHFGGLKMPFLSGIQSIRPIELYLRQVKSSIPGLTSPGEDYWQLR